MAIVYDRILTSHLPAFNREARRRDARWKDAKTADDLARMKKHDLLDVLEAISVIGRNGVQLEPSQLVSRERIATYRHMSVRSHEQP